MEVLVGTVEPEATPGSDCGNRRSSDRRQMCRSGGPVSAGGMSSFEPYVPGQPGPEKSTEIEPVRSKEVRRRWGSCLYEADAEVFAIASGICIAIWLMTGAGYFWPMWVMLGTGIPVLTQLSWSGRRTDDGIRR